MSSNGLRPEFVGKERTLAQNLSSSHTSGSNRTDWSLKLCPLVCAFALFTGCATVREPRPFDAQLWQTRQLRLEALNSWELRGRIAVKTDEEGFSASLAWQQLEDDYDIKISAPLALRSFELQGNTVGVELRSAEAPPRYANSPESLLDDAFGWSVPVSDLLYWIRGLPGPGTPVDDLQLDSDGRLSALWQSGWEIKIERYARVGRYQLPSKLSLQRSLIRVRLIIQKWKQK